MGGIGDERHSIKSGRETKQDLPFFDSPILLVNCIKGERS